MTKFLCTTQGDWRLTFNGPSGKQYESEIGKPFEVSEEADIEMFRSQPKIFEEVNLVTKVAKALTGDEGPKLQSEEERLAEFLSGVKVLSKKKIAEIVDKYVRLDQLIADIESKLDLSDLLTKKESDALTEAVLNRKE